MKIRQGPFKGYRGRVVEIKGQSVRVELESQMKVILGIFMNICYFVGSLFFAFSMEYNCCVFAVDRNNISDNVVVSTPYR